MDFRTRAQWGARFNPSKVPTFATPVDLLFIHHNVMAPTGNPNQDMQNTEQVDISRFGTPSYKWAIHPSGVVLEGMTNHWSPDTYQYNDKLSIMFMGNFENDQPTLAAIKACRELVQRLKDTKMFTSNGRVLGHRDVYPTACPGKNLYARLGELLIPLPTPSPSPVSLLRKDNMVLQDPTSKGIWVVEPSGAVFSYDGAPYLGGTNNPKMNANNFACIGIAAYIDAKGEGYQLILDFGPAPANTGDRYRRFRFPRDWSARV